MNSAAWVVYMVMREGLYRLHGCFRETVTIRTKQGRLTLPTQDCGIGAPLFRRRQYEYDASLRALRFLKDQQFIPQNNVHMLDVGANIGVISIGLLLANEISSAVAIEPEPKNFGLLLKNVEQNGLSKRLTCLQVAAGETESTLTMELSPNNPGDHRILPDLAARAGSHRNESSRRTVQVQSLPLPQILALPEIQSSAAATPSMLWIDVQGYEGYIFAGAQGVLGSGLPTVSEVWPYGILRAGMSLETFASIVTGIWTDYWIIDRFVRYPITVFDRYLDELGPDGDFENVIFTTSHTLESNSTTSAGRESHSPNAPQYP